MIGEIVSILTDRGRGSREYRNTNIPSNIACKDIWSDALDEARRRGYTVVWEEGYVQIGQGTFQDNEGGAMFAQQFLRGA